LGGGVVLRWGHFIFLHRNSQGNQGLLVILIVYHFSKCGVSLGALQLLRYKTFVGPILIWWDSGGGLLKARKDTSISFPDSLQSSSPTPAHHVH
jgi:hypothetical protein